MCRLSTDIFIFKWKCFVLKKWCCVWPVARNNSVHVQGVIQPKIKPLCVKEAICVMTPKKGYWTYIFFSLSFLSFFFFFPSAKWGMGKWKLYLFLVQELWILLLNYCCKSYFTTFIFLRREKSLRFSYIRIFFWWKWSLCFAVLHIMRSQFY